MSTPLQQAIESYRNAITQTDWVARETYKFEFTAWVREKIDWDAQSDDEVLQLLTESQQVRYTGAGNVRGINFLTAPGRYNSGILLTLLDVEIFRYCVEEAPANLNWEGKLPPYPALSAWVAALFPEKWFPTGKTGFSDTVAYLFPEAKDLRKTGLKYITDIQPWFLKTKELLQDSGIGEVYLSKLQASFSDSPDLNLSPKNTLSTGDWAWITQDFHYFVEQEIMTDKNAVKKADASVEQLLPVPQLHQQVLDVLLAARDNYPDFYFGLRKNNNYQRIERGFWFQGNEFSYLYVPLYARSGGQQRTASIGLELNFSEGVVSSALLRVKHGEETDQNILSFYQAIANQMKLMEPGKRVDQKRSYDFPYPSERSLAEIVSYYLAEQRPLIEALIKEYGLSDEMHFDEGDFNQRVARIEAVRKQGLLRLTRAEVNGDADQDDLRFWLISPGAKADQWPDFQSQGIIAIGWDDLGDLQQYGSYNEVLEQLMINSDSDIRPSNNALACYQFSHDIKEGDIVIAKSGRYRLLGVGIVMGEYEFDDSRERYKHIIPVEWSTTGSWKTPDSMVVKTLTDITDYPGYPQGLIAIMDDGELLQIAKEDQKQYWWLQANPKQWSLSERPVGTIQFYTARNERGNKRQVYRNFEAAAAGDLMIGYEGYPTKAAVAIMRVVRPLYETEEGEERLEFEIVQQFKDGVSWEELKDMPELAELRVFKNNQGSLYQLEATEYETIFAALTDKAFTADEQDEQIVMEAYNYREDPDKPFLPAEDFKRYAELLRRKKNLILQGPPGVGKTYLARHLAYQLSGYKDDSTITTVQFHQSFSYEDFIQGYRPSKDGGLTIRNGVFFDLCTRARTNREKPFFLIIDEINRGNLSKIFGELMMLIEADKRKEKYGTQLLYAEKGEDSFYVPENLYLIGTMNTADRSLALVDYALRRRFVFVDLVPNFGDAFQALLLQAFLAPALRAHIVKQIEQLNTQIAKDHGDGFRLGHSYFCDPPDLEENHEDWFRAVVDYEVKPLLHELYFDQPDRVVSLLEPLELPAE